jgi:catechol 2,3-dioxygenase-like lactoylglutathione lyase family enzyme
MPKGIFHAVVLTDDLEETVRFLTEVCGIAPVTRYRPEAEQLATTFGWPVETGTTDAALVGQGPGMLELIAIPPSVRAAFEPGVRLLAVATTDVEGRAGAAKAAGFDPGALQRANVAGGGEIVIVPVAVGGVGFELVRFG